MAKFKPGDRIFVDITEDKFAYVLGRCEGIVISKIGTLDGKDILEVRFYTVKNGKPVGEKRLLNYVVNEKYLHLLHNKKGNMRW